MIETLALEPHPEGGWYRETWRGSLGENGRAVGTAILFLLESYQHSHWHRVDANELWIWQAGDPLTLEIADADTGYRRSILLGAEVSQEQQLQGLVPAQSWQAARPVAEQSRSGYTLVTCVVCPGFEFAGFELAPPDWEPGRVT